MNDSNWEILTEVFDRLEAEMFKAALEAEGVPVVLSQEAAGNLYPVTFGKMACIQVFVPAASLEHARAWLKNYEQGREQDNREEEQ